MKGDKWYVIVCAAIIAFAILFGSVIIASELHDLGKVLAPSPISWAG